MKLLSFNNNRMQLDSFLEHTAIFILYHYHLSIIYPSSITVIISSQLAKYNNVYN